MKKYITTVILSALMVADVIAMDENVKMPQSKRVLTRIDSRARIPVLKDKNLLPAPMSTEDYIRMLMGFLDQNSQLIDPYVLIAILLKDLKELMEAISELNKFRPNLDKEFPVGSVEEKNKFIHFAEGTDQSFPENRDVRDVSCPNVMKYVKKILSQVSDLESKDPSDLSKDQLLQLEHLKWIADHFSPFVEKIQKHEIDPTDQYDSGLTDADIDLLVKLMVGPNRVFGIKNVSEAEKERFIDDALKVMLRNATGFQRALSLLLVSILNSITKQQFWHIEIDFIKGERGSYKKYDEVHLSESDNCSLDLSLFHEITHSFHNMLKLHLLDNELISNVSIINSRELNLIDQYFPMLRPQIINPILRAIEELINQYFGQDFNKITEAEKQKLVVVVLEPIIRNAMMNGFGNFIFPNYKSGDSLQMSLDMLTTKKMAMCVYLSGILNATEAYPSLSEKDDSVNAPTNILTFKGQCTHPLFEKVKITPSQIEFSREWFESDSLWNSSEEKLTIQGNSIVLIGGDLYYIQDRQNEHIYLIRAHEDQTRASSIARRFRYHQARNHMSDCAEETFKLMLKCCPSLKADLSSSIIKIGSPLDNLLMEAGKPSTEEKYGLPDADKDQDLQYGPLNQELFNLLEPFDHSYIDLSAPANKELAEKFAKYDQMFNEEARTAKAKSSDDIRIIHEKYNNLKEAAYVDEIKRRVEHIVKSKKNINAKNKDGITALSCAVSRGNPEIVKILLDNGADVTFRDESGNNLMDKVQYFPFEKFTAIIDMLLDKGLNINDKNNKGETILHSMAYNAKNFRKQFKFLLSRGANLEEKNSSGETPLLYNILRGGSYDSIEEITNLGAKIDARDYKGLTALHYAMGRDIEDLKNIVTLLTARGLDINVKDNKGDTVLHTVARKGEKLEEVIKFLVEKGADLNIKNDDGKTPLELAKEKFSPNAQFFEKLEKK